MTGLIHASSQTASGRDKKNGLGRRKFCALQGLSLGALDAWRRRPRQSGSVETPVAVEIAEIGAEPAHPAEIKSREPSRLFRILLPQGLRVELEPGFDAGELRRLVATLVGA